MSLPKTLPAAAWLALLMVWILVLADAVPAAAQAPLAAERARLAAKAEAFRAEAAPCLDVLEKRCMALFPKDGARMQRVLLCEGLRGGWFASLQAAPVNGMERMEGLLNLRPPDWEAIYGTREHRMSFVLTPSVGNTWEVAFTNWAGRRGGVGQFYVWARDFWSLDGHRGRVIPPFPNDHFDISSARGIFCTAEDAQVRSCRAKYPVRTCRRFAPRGGAERDHALLVVVVGARGSAPARDFLEHYDLMHDLAAEILARLLEHSCRPAD